MGQDGIVKEDGSPIGRKSMAVQGREGMTINVLNKYIIDEEQAFRLRGRRKKKKLRRRLSKLGVGH